jgi:hypothetical protein
MVVAVTELFNTFNVIWLAGTNEAPVPIEISKSVGGVTIIFVVSKLPLTVNDCSADGPEPETYVNPVKLLTEVVIVGVPVAKAKYMAGPLVGFEFVTPYIPVMPPK